MKYLYFVSYCVFLEEEAFYSNATFLLPEPVPGVEWLGKLQGLVFNCVKTQKDGVFNSSDVAITCVSKLSEQGYD